MHDRPPGTRAEGPHPLRSLGRALLLGALLVACAPEPTPVTPDPVPQPEPTPPGPPTLPDPATAWTPLFNGQDFSGWYAWMKDTGRSDAPGGDPRGIFKVQNGEIHVLGIPDTGQTQDDGYLSTLKNDYQNYRLKLQYRWGTERFAPRNTEPRDAGVLYHATGSDRIWPASLELQIMEGNTGDLWQLAGTALNSTVSDPAVNPPVYNPLGLGFSTQPAGPTSYRRVVRAPGTTEKSGWNDVELVVSGNEAAQIVNGQVAARATNLRGPDGRPLGAGRILLQAEGAEVYYRNIDLRPLAYTPPLSGAQVLVGPGVDASAWQSVRTGGAIDWPLQQDLGVLSVNPGRQPGAAVPTNDIRTAENYKNFRLHAEFRVPSTPSSAPEQERGNSGIYLQGRYEVQILDSYGKAAPGNTDLGALYGQAAPSSNAGLPAETWQSYDIDFTAAQFKDGQKTQNARVTVWLNGEKVQDNVELSGTTPYALLPETDAPGPILLQDHDNRVQFRNLWIVKK